jgi:hypothetical protein
MIYVYLLKYLPSCQEAIFLIITIYKIELIISKLPARVVKTNEGESPIKLENNPTPK